MCIFATLGLGVFNTWLRGDDLFGLTHIPKFGTYDDVQRHLLANAVVKLHRLAANAILILAGLHACAALVHYCIVKDTVLQRMVPWLKSR